MARKKLSLMSGGGKGRKGIKEDQRAGLTYNSYLDTAATDFP